MGGNRGCGRDDVERGDVGLGAAVYVGIRWVMAMRAGLRTTVDGCLGCFVVAARDRYGYIRSTVGIS
jgi:hypothetical protein